MEKPRFRRQLTRWLAALLVLLLWGLPSAPSVSAFWFGQEPEILRLDDERFTVADYRNWYKHWQEPDTSLPETPDDYIDWLLMAREAERMQLQDNPQYKHKIDVFLKFRTLMQLKSEEIDRRLQKPEPAELRALYEKDYLPRLELKVISLPDFTQTQLLTLSLLAGMPDYLAASTAGMAKFPLWRPLSLRPVSIQGKFAEIFSRPRAVDEIFALEGERGEGVIFQVTDIDQGSDADFASFSDKLARKLIKEREQALNTSFIESLTSKYPPLIKQDRIDSLSPDSEPEDLAETVLEVGDANISGQVFLELLAREQKLLRGRDGKSLLSQQALQRRVIDNVVAQTLVGFEALQRGYEKRPPLKDDYDFYCRNRLVSEWKKAVLEPQVEIGDSELKEEYERLAEHWQRPDEYDVVWVRTGDRQLADQAAAELKRGGDFFKVMTPRFGAGIEMQRRPLKAFEPFLQKIIADLAPGEVSPPLEREQETVFVKLVRRRPGKKRDFAEVADDLGRELRQRRLKEVNRQMLEKLRSLSAIKVDQAAWQKLRQELEAVSKQEKKQ